MRTCISIYIYLKLLKGKPLWQRREGWHSELGQGREVFNKKQTNIHTYIHSNKQSNITSQDFYLQCLTREKTSLRRRVHVIGCDVIHMHTPGDVDYTKEPFKGIVRPHLLRWDPRHRTPKKAALWEGVLLFGQKFFAIGGTPLPFQKHLKSLVAPCLARLVLDLQACPHLHQLLR